MAQRKCLFFFRSSATLFISSSPKCCAQHDFISVEAAQLHTNPQLTYRHSRTYRSRHPWATEGHEMPHLELLGMGREVGCRFHHLRRRRFGDPQRRQRGFVPHGLRKNEKVELYVFRCCAVCSFLCVTRLSHEIKPPPDQGAPRLGGAAAMRSLEPKAKDIEIRIKHHD